jgi:hypothetical protein
MSRTTFSGPVASTNGFVGDLEGAPTVPTYTVATVPSAATVGKVIYVSDGLAGAPCLAVADGSDWISPAGTAVAAA